jgi:hypothetical protein
VIEQDVTLEGHSVKTEKRKIVLIPRKEYRRRRGNCSRATEFLYLKREPGHPLPMPGGRYYIEHEIDEYLERLAAARNVGGEE